MHKRYTSLGLVAALVASLLTVLSIPLAANAAVTLPATTSWTNAGLQEMVRLSGRLKTSIDGLGTINGTGNLQVEKPAGAKVVAAFMTLAGTSGTANLAAPSDVSLNGQAVSFSHKASVTSATQFGNFFAEVTDIIKPTIDASGAGLIDVAVNEGAGQTSYDGSSLIVIFDDPNTLYSSVVIAFGASKTAGDSFSLSFPALNANELTGHRVSVGIGYGYQVSSGMQSSTIDITTSSQVSSSRIAEYAGSFDDGQAANGALVTVGGIGDSVTNPTIGAPYSDPADDELYNLGAFLSQGDTDLTIKTRNATGDDNLFQAVFIFNRIALAGATTVFDPGVGGSPVQDRNAPNTVTDNDQPLPAAATPAPSQTPSPSSGAVYVGPEIESFSNQALYHGETLLISGKKLDRITELNANGIKLDFEVLKNGDIKLSIPANFPTGGYDILAKSEYGQLTHVGAFKVSAKPTGREINMLSPTKNVAPSFVKAVTKRLSAVSDPFDKVKCIVNTPTADLTAKVAENFCRQLLTGKFAGAELVTELRYNADFTKGFWVRIFLGWQKKA